MLLARSPRQARGVPSIVVAGPRAISKSGVGRNHAAPMGPIARLRNVTDGRNCVDLNEGFTFASDRVRGPGLVLLPSVAAC